jgi:RNA polymerase sigma-70 factor (family 1)
MDTHEQQRFAQIRAGNEQAFESLFREHYAVLCAFSRKFVTDPDAAEEIVQDLFLGLWEKRADLMPTLSLRSYLFAAVRNGCLNHLKHIKVRGRHVEHVAAQPLEVAEDPQEALQAAELAARISLAIDALPDRCGEIFKLSRFEGLKYQEIADRLQLSPRTVEVQIGKALKLLREQLGEYMPVWMLLFLLEEWIR